MEEEQGVTLSHQVDDDGIDRPRPEPVLVLVLECGRPRAGSVRYRLSGVTKVVIGRSTERRAERTGTELTVGVPDRWMSSHHARIEPNHDRWVVTDTGSKNGSTVDGAVRERAVLTDGSLIDLGHTLFMFFECQPIEPDAAAELELVPTDSPLGLATLTPVWDQELARLRQIASSEVPILIEGEIGTGKEMLARAIHGQSKRPGPFVLVNCGALRKNLVERELFGYKKSAFKGARVDHLGLARSADAGTLFLDEISDLLPNAQAALLQMLQDREVMPVGDTPVEIDLRVIAATHHDLDHMVAKGNFRYELFSRLTGSGSPCRRSPSASPRLAY